VCLAEVVAARGQCEPLDPRGAPIRDVPPPLASFDFRVSPGTTTFVPTLEVVTSGFELTLLYPYQNRDAPPSATGAGYWVEGELVSRTKVEICARALQPQQPRCVQEFLTIDLGRIQDSVTRVGVPVAEYDVRLRHLADGPELSPVYVTPVRVRTGEMTLVQASLQDALGEIAGQVTLNGNAPGPGLKLCVAGIDHQLVDARVYTWCMDLEDAGAHPTGDGRFQLLLPAGEGRGSVCLAEVVAALGQCEPLDRRGAPIRNVQPPLASFEFKVDRGTTRYVTIR